MPIVTVESEAKPLSTDRNFKKLWISRPDPISNTIVSAISATISPRCSRLAPPLTLRAPEPLIASFKLQREPDHAGNSPENTAVASETQTVNNRTRPSIEVSSIREMLAEWKFTRSLTIQNAAAIPRTHGHRGAVPRSGPRSCRRQLAPAAGQAQC